MQFIDNNHIKEEMSDKEFKNCISEIKKTRKKHSSKDGYICVYSEQFKYKDIPYLIKILRYYRTDVKFKKIQGHNRISKWVVLDHPESINGFISEMSQIREMLDESVFKHEIFLHTDTSQGRQYYWTLKRMVIRMHTQAEQDIDILLSYKDLKLKWKIFKVNEFVELRLFRDKTLIYVNNKRFNQCKYLFLNIPVNKVQEYDEIDSIDEASEVLDGSMEYQDFDKRQIPPEDEFWGHCSNLQAWSENNYDTRLVHRNLAFPLLRKLTEIGDPIANKVFKEEIAKRLESDNINVVQFLINGKYIDYLTDDELNSLSLSRYCKFRIENYKKFVDQQNKIDDDPELSTEYNSILPVIDSISSYKDYLHSMFQLYYNTKQKVKKNPYSKNIFILTITIITLITIIIYLIRWI